MQNEINERRRSPRVPARLEGRIQLLIPEESFTPFAFEGHTRDICLSGLGFATTQVPGDVFLRIIRKIRCVEVWLTLPGQRRESRLFGRAAWVRLDEQTTPPTTLFGVAFENLSEGDTEALNAAVSYFLASGTRRLPGVKLQAEIESD